MFIKSRRLDLVKHFLIVVDIQNDFVDGSLGSSEAVGIIENAANKINSHEGEIIVTFDTHFENYLETSEGKNLPVPHCIKGSHGFELNPTIIEALKGKKYTSVEKITFGSTKLPEIIESLADGEDFRVTLIGLCTDICVISNALILKAAFPEKEISVDPSCMAGVTVQSHNAALETMKMCQITVL